MRARRELRHMRQVALQKDVLMNLASALPRRQPKQRSVGSNGAGAVLPSIRVLLLATLSSVGYTMLRRTCHP